MNCNLIFGGDIAPLRADRTGQSAGNLGPVIREADLALANLEIALSNRGAPLSGKPIVHTGPPQAIQGAVRCRFRRLQSR